MAGDFAPQGLVGSVGGTLQGTSVAPLGGGGGLSGGPLQIGSLGFPPGSNASQSQYGTGVIPGMMNVYNQLLGANQSHYNNVLGAYQTGQSVLQGALPAINSAYAPALSGIMNTLGMGGALGQNGNWGVATPAFQAIQQGFESAYGATQQSLIDAGLGNTTKGAGLQNMNTQSFGRAIGGLGSSLAQTAAGYQSQYGLAGLAQAMQGLGMETGLTQAGLGPLGQQFANTAGSLTGGFGASAYGGQQYPYGYGRGGGGGGMPNLNQPGTPPHINNDPYGQYSGFGGIQNQQQPYPAPPGPQPQPQPDNSGYGYGNILSDMFSPVTDALNAGYNALGSPLGDLGTGFGNALDSFGGGLMDAGSAFGSALGDVGAAGAFDASYGGVSDLGGF